MKTKIAFASRLMLALFCAVMGANKFLHFMQMPEMPEKAGAFLGAISGSGYIFPAMGAIFLASAVLLVLGRGVLLALVALAPLVYNTIMFHVAFDMASIPMAAVFGALWLIVAVLHCHMVKPLFAKIDERTV